MQLYLILCLALWQSGTAFAIEDAKRLFDDLIKVYDRVRRPIEKPKETIKIKMILKLNQILDVAEKEQILVTSVFVDQQWNDPNLRWNPAKYGGVQMLYVPRDLIWVPDIVLYNNADGEFEVTISTKAIVSYSGNVTWSPPAVFKSMCEMDVKWFPFDTQICNLTFGSWTYDIELVDLTHKNQHRGVTTDGGKSYDIKEGIDICNYRESVEWDIMKIPAYYTTKRTKWNSPGPNPRPMQFADITYSIHLRRKPLFYTVNLILPCVGISFLTILVFYLPSNSGEKISLCISILVSITVFFLLLTEIVPATSIVLPLIGKYLLFCMLMVSLSVIMTVIVLNLHFRKPSTHKMPQWVKKVLMKHVPKLLLMQRRRGIDDESFRRVSYKVAEMAPSFERRGAAPNLTTVTSSPKHHDKSELGMQYSQHSFKRRQSPEMGNTKVGHRLSSPHVHRSASSRRDETGHQPRKPLHLDLKAQKFKAVKSVSLDYDERARNLQNLYRSPQVVKAFKNLCFIADQMREQDKDDKIDDDWNYVAMVLDRLCLWIFAVTCTMGSILTFYNDTVTNRGEALDFEKHCSPADGNFL